MSLHSMALRGMVPVGSLAAGSLASHIGAPMTLTLDGIACMLGACVFASKRSAFKGLPEQDP